MKENTEHYIVLKDETEQHVDQVVRMCELIRKCDSAGELLVANETVLKTQLMGLLVQIREARGKVAAQLEKLDKTPSIHALLSEEYTELQRKLSDTLKDFKSTPTLPTEDPNSTPARNAESSSQTVEGSPNGQPSQTTEGRGDGRASTSDGPMLNAVDLEKWEGTPNSNGQTRNTEGTTEQGGSPNGPKAEGCGDGRASTSDGPMLNTESSTGWKGIPNKPSQTAESFGDDEASPDEPERLLQRALEAVGRTDWKTWRDLVGQEADELKWTVGDLARRVAKPYTNKQYEAFADELETVDFPLVKRAFETGRQAYNSWRNSCDNPSTTWGSLLKVELQALLSSDFIIVDERQLPPDYKADRSLLTFYLGEEEATDEALKKFHILLTLTGHKGARLTFNHGAALGKYLWNNRPNLLPRRPTHDPSAFRHVAAFFRFKEICQCVRQSFDEAMDKAWDKHSQHTDRPKGGSRQGPRKKMLFKDKLTASRKSDELVGYLKEHKLWSNRLCCSREDKLNAVIVSHLRLWIEAGVLPKNPPALAIYRFLTEDCGLQSNVDPKPYANKVQDMLRDESYAKNVYREIKDTYRK